MNKDTIHRLDEIRKANDLSNKELERKLGMSNGAFDSALKASSSVKDKIIRKALEVFPTISMRWLLLGEGEMEKEDSTILADTDNLSHQDVLEIINIVDKNLDLFASRKSFRRIVLELEAGDFKDWVKKEIKELQKQIKTLSKG